MPRVFALLLLVATAVLVTRLGVDDARGTALAFGFALIAATLVGDLFERFKLPRLTGYLIFGMLCGPSIANIISRPMARELQLVNGLAIALIAFVAGLELNFGRLRSQIAMLLRLGSTILAVLFLGLWAIVWVLWPWLPLVPEATGPARLALSALLATLITSFSPTVTIAVIADARARGPLSHLVLALVVLGDLALIVLFTLSMQLVRWTLGGARPGDVSLFAQLSWEIAGSFAFGAFLGALFAFYLRTVGREVTVMLLALCAICSQIGSPLHFEPLLVALAAGMVVENIAPPSGDALKEAVERGALPVLVIFFAAAGAALPLATLASVGLLVIGISLVRLGLIRAGGWVAVRASGVDPEIGSLAWMGLVSQAGVTLGLTILVSTEFPEWGTRVQTLMVALISIHELAGPVMFRRALARAGEVGRLGD
jgi:Kef-type K+ transport system membrane component KefB